MRFYIKQNDTLPPIDAVLYDASGTLVDLTGASVRFHMRKIGETSAKVDSDASVTDATGGSVRYAWSASDTDTVGKFEAEWEVTFSGGGVETFPTRTPNIQVFVTDDIA